MSLPIKGGRYVVRRVCSKETMELIQKFFDSEDKEMWKLAQRMCHQYRLNYFVMVDRYTTSPKVTGRIWYAYTPTPVKYSLRPLRIGHNFRLSVYEIDLQSKGKFQRYEKRRKEFKSYKEEKKYPNPYNQNKMYGKRVK